MTEQIITQAANQLWDAEKSQTVCAPVRELIGADDISAAYEVQSLITDRKLAHGEKIVGRKIGLTSFAVQKQLGVDQPDFGTLMESKKFVHGDTVPFAELMQPKAETEIAFILKSDLDGSIDLNAIRNAIDYACVAIEVVGSRIENWNIRITDTIADNASASHFVLGNQHVQLSEVDLKNCKMSMQKNGLEVSVGIGSACLGNPLNAMMWLAKTMQENGSPLRAGEIILSGALGPVVDVTNGDSFSAEIEGIGSVSATFS